VTIVGPDRASPAGSHAEPDGSADDDTLQPRSSWRASRDERATLARPSRPAAVEAAAALLIVSGWVRLLGIIASLGAATGARAVNPAIDLAILMAMIVTGFLVRAGRGWVFAVNVVAVLAFIELLGLPSPVSLAFAPLFALTFAAVFLNKPWFDAMRVWRAATERDRRP
jgi:hypothetical protein